MLAVSVCCIAVSSAADRPIFFSDFQHIDNLHPHLTVSVPIVVGASLHSNATQPLDQPTRLQIYSYIKDNPGVHFRGICGSLGLSLGVVQYHLGVLEHAGFITAYTDGQNKRYFESNAYSKTDMQLISLMRHETTAKILTILAQDRSALQKDIARTLGISPQALTWQMNQLKKSGLIISQREGINVKYSLNCANAIKLILNLNDGLNKS